MAQRRQCIGGFAGLGDEEADAAFGQERLAIAEFGSDIDAGGEFGDLLEPVTGDLRGIKRGAAGDHADLAGLPEHIRELAEAEAFLGGVIEIMDGGGDRIRLLENFFQHEMRVIAFIGKIAFAGDRFDFALGSSAVAIKERCFLLGEDGDIAFFEIRHLFAEGREGDGIRSEHHAFITETDSERGAQAGGIEGIGGVGEKDGECIRAVQFMDDFEDGFLRGDAGL